MVFLGITQVATLLSCVLFAALIPVQSVIVFFFGVVFGLLLTITFIDSGLINASTISLSWLLLELLSVIIIGVICLLRYLSIAALKTKSFMVEFVKRLVNDCVTVNINRPSFQIASTRQEVGNSMKNINLNKCASCTDDDVYHDEEIESSEDEVNADENRTIKKNSCFDEYHLEEPEPKEETKGGSSFVNSKETVEEIPAVKDESLVEKKKGVNSSDTEEMVKVVIDEVASGKESLELLNRIIKTRNNNSNEQVIDDLIALVDIGTNDNNPTKSPDITYSSVTEHKTQTGAAKAENKSYEPKKIKSAWQAI